LWTISNAHNGFINGILVDPLFKDISKGFFYTCSGTDKTLKKWKLNLNQLEGGKDSKTPVQSHTSEYGLYCLDHHFNDANLVTGGENLGLSKTFNFKIFGILKE
jgi:WD40 repeat protein